MAFTDNETARLREVFSLDEAQVELLLGGSAFIFEQAAYEMTPPETLQTELIAAGVSDEHAQAFCTVWQSGAAECVASLKQERSVLAPRHLTSIDWQLCDVLRVHTRTLASQ